MKVFIKKLGSQESGYSGNEPNQRGKYILIPRHTWDFFPHLTQTTLNDFVGLNLMMMGESQSVGVNYHYNNAKHLPRLGLKRKHDERRIYRNKTLDRLLNLDRGTIFVVFKNEENYLFATSFNEVDRSYSEWETFAGKKNIEFEKLPLSLRQGLDFSNPLYAGTVANLEQIAEDSIKRTRSREQQQPLIGDPANPLESLFKNQDDFKHYIRKMYDGKCAIRQKSLVNRKFEGLEAAHIMPHNQRGPLLPTNGILMSRDLHDCFERGLFTLDKYNKIKISSTVASQSPINEFKGQRIEPLQQFKLYEPYKAYTEFHRKNIFKP